MAKKTTETNRHQNDDSITKSAVREKLDSINASGLENVVIISVKKDGEISIDSTVTNTVEMQYLLNRSSFELHMFEMGQRVNAKKAAE